MFGFLTRWARGSQRTTARREPVFAGPGADSGPPVVPAVDLVAPVRRPRTPAVSRHKDADLEQHPVGRHAQELRTWLIDLPTIHTDETSDGAVEWVLARDVQQAYGEMCHEAGWAMHAWHVVGAEMRARFDFRKTYRWIREPDGERHRLCVYPKFIGVAGGSVAGASVARSATARVAGAGPAGCVLKAGDGCHSAPEGAGVEKNPAPGALSAPEGARKKAA